jgi:hypothetical protein
MKRGQENIVAYFSRLGILCVLIDSKSNVGRYSVRFADSNRRSKKGNLRFFITEGMFNHILNSIA